MARSRLAVSISLAAAMTMGTGVGSVYAQEEEGGSALEEITITGTRIRRDDFSSANPSTVMGGDFLDNLGIVNLGDALQSLPSNVGNTTSTTNSNSNFFSGNNIANLRGLNPFFGSRTLTLVDSRRHVPTNQADSVDLNFIPTILIERFETVTGGASASYGSGAISGVNNIIMNRSLEGGKIQVDFGQTGEGDGDDFHYGLAYGLDVGDRGHFVIGYEAQDSDRIGNCSLVRDWCSSNSSIQTNNDYLNNSDPRYVLKTNVRQQDTYKAGGIPSKLLRFNDDGTDGTIPYVRGNEFNQGGDGRGQYEETNIRSNIDRQSLYAMFDYEISDSLNLYAEASWGESLTGTPQQSTANNQLLWGDNAYLLQLGDKNPCAGDFLCFFNRDLVGMQGHNPRNRNDSEAQRFAIGLEGVFGETTWTWDVYYQYGESDKLQAVYGNLHAEAWNFARDAVFSVPGDMTSEIVCRVDRDGMNPNSLVDPRIAEGCVPMNLLGINNISPAAYDYAFGQLVETTNVRQDVVEGVASGEVWEGFGAGPVQAAIGASWRLEELLNLSDPSQPDHIRTDYLIQYGESFGGEVEVLEYFAELDVPLTEDLNIRGAIRRSDYTNTAGFNTGIDGNEFDYGITTWKIDGTWQATDWLALRGSRSRDIRAPNFRELYYEQIIPAGSPFGYCSNEWTGNLNVGIFSFTGDPCTVNLKGGLSLEPETGDTTTFGVVLTPDNFNVRLAADFFQIKIADGINAASTDLTLTGCFQGQDPFFCSSISGTLIDPNNPVGGFSVINEVRPEAFNFAQYKVEGVDFSADWLGTYDFGTISLRLLASRMLHQIVTPSASNPSLTEDLAGVVGNGNPLFVNYASAPDWTANLTGTYSNGPITVTMQTRWIAEGKIRGDRTGPEDSGYTDKLADSIYSNRIGDYFISSLNGSYSFDAFGSEMSVFASINNLFDRDPPVIGAGTGGANPVFYDTIGRNFRVGLRADF